MDDLFAVLPDEVRRRLGRRPEDLTRLGASRVMRGEGCVGKVPRCYWRPSLSSR